MVPPQVGVSKAQSKIARMKPVSGKLHSQLPIYPSGPSGGSFFDRAGPESRLLFTRHDPGTRSLEPESAKIEFDKAFNMSTACTGALVHLMHAPGEGHWSLVSVHTQEVVLAGVWFLKGASQF